MDQTIVFDPPSSTFNYDDIYAGDGIAIPPLDYAMLTDDDLSFPDNLVFAQGSDADLDFTIQDLDFIDDLLSDPDPGSEFESPVHDFSPSQLHHPVAHSEKSAVSVSQSPGTVEGAFNLEINDGAEPPRVSVAESAKRQQESSDHVSSQGSGNGERDVSKASGSNFRRKLDYQSPESGSCDHLSSHGSGEINSRVSPVENPPSPDSCQSSPVFSSSFNVSTLKSQNVAINRLAESRIKIEEVGSKFTPKRKKEQQYEASDETRTNKFRKSSEAMENASVDLSVRSEEDEKKNSRLMRNRESAQLSRQRKKQYVEELEDKVKSMHSTITELNSKISYIMAENATLRQQMNGGGVCPPPPPGMYPMAPMGYPWMPCPPYLVKPQGSQVPLVPIPRLKPHQPASAPKISKKSEKLGNKKDVGKTKKVASISFLGLLFFMLLFGGLVPIINVKYGGSKLSNDDKFNKAHSGRILIVDGHLNESSHDGGSAYMDRKHGHESGLFKGKHCGTNVGQKEHPSQIGTGADGSVPVGNSSEPLAASLYVPRNDKLVKIDGNLIIHSVLASERAVSSHETVQMKTSEETRLAIARNHAPYHVTGSGQSNTRGSKLDDSRLQEWFSEDLSGSLLRSGMCTEVFQFDVSPTPGSIVPATPMTNTTTSNERINTNRARNRRFLSGYPIPLDLHALNVSKEPVGPNTEKGKLQGDNSTSSMVVSVLVDPREAGEIDAEGVMRSKSVSRIFVVLLIDSVRYVTYSCMLPFMGGGGNKLSAE